MEVLKLGVIADVQFCDRENGFNFERTKERFYRASITRLDNALQYFESYKCKKVLQLGDLIDGRCKALQSTEEAMNIMKERFNTNKFETFHVIGNHELYNLSRDMLRTCFIGDSLRKYQKKEQDLHYYKVNLTEDICLLVLDCYEISVLNKRNNIDNHPDYLLAREILTANNQNESWNEPKGATYAKYVAFNGGLSEHQLKWLERKLVQATKNNQIVILAGHIPIASSQQNPLCLLWNNDAVLNIIFRFPCVKMYLCGHDHIGNILQMNKFIHITFPGIIESMSDQCGYGILEITKAQLHLPELKGYWKSISFYF